MDGDDPETTPDAEGRTTVSLVVEAPPEQVWDMVADVTRMGEWSPECYRCRWIGRHRRPVEGARFRGYNKQGVLRWMTTNEVTEAVRGEAFVFRTRENGNHWGFRLESEGGGTRITQFRQLPATRPWYALVALRLLGGPERYDAGVPDGMRRTLERLKATAEAT